MILQTPKKLLVHFTVECNTIQILTEIVSNISNGNTSVVVQNLHVKVIIQNVNFCMILQMPKELLLHFPVECDTIQILTESVSNVTNGNTGIIPVVRDGRAYF